MMDNEELRKWQKKQIERSYIDNFINGVIEGCTVIEDEWPVSQFHFEHSYCLEESAILMAINAHGLQQTDSRNMNNIRKHPYKLTPGSSSSSSLSLSSTPHRNTFSANKNNSAGSTCTNNDLSNLVETAVSVAIQKQGLGLEPNG